MTSSIEIGLPAKGKTMQQSKSLLADD
jgi:hypothetical protein